MNSNPDIEVQEAKEKILGVPLNSEITYYPLLVPKIKGMYYFYQNKLK